ncbi:MAG: hypothetical protein JSS86_22455, partial [Cyanobacteria bacterium SZAS LIN-2]|nr:hypothetical protein [Cyanobacteria bacterium SZAS LIN-2]
MNAFALFLLALALAFVSTLSLLAKNEGIRGMGRVAGGLSWTLFAAFLLVLTCGTHQLPGEYAVPSGFLLLMGLVTIASGARKFARRNI